MGCKNQLSTSRVDFRVEQAHQFLRQQSVQTGIEFIDNQRQSFTEDVEHWPSKKQQVARATGLILQLKHGFSMFGYMVEEQLVFLLLFHAHLGFTCRQI